MKTRQVVGAAALMAALTGAAAAGGDQTVLTSLSNDWRACAAANAGKALQGLPDTAGSGKWYFGCYAADEQGHVSRFKNRGTGVNEAKSRAADE